MMEGMELRSTLLSTLPFSPGFSLSLVSLFPSRASSLFCAPLHFPLHLGITSPLPISPSASISSSCWQLPVTTMALVSNGALIETNAEEIEERALEALEEPIADLPNTMKALRRTNDRLSATLATAVSRTAQLRLSFTELSSFVTEVCQSLHRIEHNTNRSVAFSPSVFSSAITSHLAVPIAPHLHFFQPANLQPAVPSFTSSIPPQLTISASTAAEQIQHSRTTYIDRLPLPTVHSSGSSTSSSITASTPNHSLLTANTSSASIRATFQQTFTEISPPLSRVEKQFAEPPGLPYLASFFSPSTETSDSQIAKSHTATTLPNSLTPHSFMPERLVENLNPIDLDSEGEGGQSLIPLTESDSNEEEFPTPSSFTTLTFEILPHTAQPQPGLPPALTNVQIVTPIPFHSAPESSAITSQTHRSSTSRTLPQLSERINLVPFHSVPESSAITSRTHHSSTSRTLLQLSERTNLVPFPVNRTDSTGCSHFHCLPSSKQFVHTLEVSLPSPFSSTVPPEPPKEITIHREPLLWPLESFSDATKLGEENLDANRPHFLRPPLTQRPTNTTLVLLNKLSLPRLPFWISCLIIDVDSLVQSMAQWASITAPSALQFITVRLSDKKALPPLRDKIGWCISSNSSLVKDPSSCRMLCLNGQEIVLLGSINDWRSSSHHMKSMLNSWEQAFLCGKCSKCALQTMRVLELLYEMTEVKHAVEFLSKTTLLQLISTLVSNISMEPILRTRAMIICGRVLSKENIIMFISTIECRLVPSKTGDADECTSALEALHQIGSPLQRATLLLPSTPDAARCLIDAAFGRQSLGEQRLGKQTAILHALGNIAGENRSQNAILNGDAEENLRRLIYEVATRSSTLTLSGTMQSNSLMSRCILPLQREKSKGYGGDPSKHIAVNRKSHEVISIGLTKESVTSPGESPFDTSISPPPFSSTATTAYEKYNLFDEQRAEDKPTPCHNENDANISTCVELHCVPIADGSKMVQSALANTATSQWANDQVATGMDNLWSHMGSRALTETEWNIDSQAEPPNIVNDEPKHQNLRIREMDGGMRTDGVSLFAVRRSTLQDQLQHIRNILESEIGLPMTQSSFVGSSCATTIFVHATSVPALLLPEIFASSIRAKAVAEFHPTPLLINLEDKVFVMERAMLRSLIFSLFSLIVVHFTASWCMPSVAMNSFFEELASAYQDVLFLTVDVDDVKAVASKMEVKAMPTFLILRDGAQVDKLVGANPDEIKKRVDSFVQSIRVYVA